MCESGGLRKFVRPGIFILCNAKGRVELKEGTDILKSLVDKIVNFDGSKFDFDIDSILCKKRHANTSNYEFYLSNS